MDLMGAGRAWSALRGHCHLQALLICVGGAAQQRGWRGDAGSDGATEPKGCAAAGEQRGVGAAPPQRMGSDGATTRQLQCRTWWRTRGCGAIDALSSSTRLGISTNIPMEDR